MRVLVIEDDVSVVASLDMLFSSEGFSTQTTDLGEDGIDLAKVYDFDIAILAGKLPDISGYEVLRQIRAKKISVPVIILSSAFAIEDKVKAFGFGADDYMTKPFHSDELIARIHAIVRRSRGHAQAVITTGDIVLNMDTKLVTVAGKPIHLTGKEYQMLELLSLRKGTTLTKESILSHLYGGMDEPEMKIIDVFICKLRKKLEHCEGVRHIETVWGRGYVMRDPDAESVTLAPVTRNPVGVDDSTVFAKIGASYRHGGAL